MTKLTPEFPTTSDPKIEALCAEYPEIRKWRDALDTVQSKFEFGLDAGSHLKDGEWQANLWNCTMDAYFGHIDAMNQLCPNTIDRKAFAERLLEIWDRCHPRRPMPLGQKRAIAVAVAYKDGFRPNLVGSKDTPMEAARQVASLMEGLSLDTGPEAIRKSIQRFRDSLGEEEVFRLNRETLKLEVFQAKSVLLKGLPNRRGRPPSKKFER